MALHPTSPSPTTPFTCGLVDSWGSQPLPHTGMAWSSPRLIVPLPLPLPLVGRLVGTEGANQPGSIHTCQHLMSMAFNRCVFSLVEATATAGRHPLAGMGTNQVMLDDIDHAAALGADGAVFGCLQPDGSVHEGHTAVLLARCKQHVRPPCSVVRACVCRVWGKGAWAVHVCVWGGRGGGEGGAGPHRQLVLSQVVLIPPPPQPRPPCTIQWLLEPRRASAHMLRSERPFHQRAA